MDKEQPEVEEFDLKIKVRASATGDFVKTISLQSRDGLLYRQMSYVVSNQPDQMQLENEHIRILLKSIIRGRQALHVTPKVKHA